jgi:hypothetical protein
MTQPRRHLLAQPGPDGGDAAAGPVLTLVSRSWCSLCDTMREALAPIAARHGLRVVERDCDADAALEALCGDRVPVLYAGDPAPGREIAEGRVDAASLDSALAARVAGSGVFR